MDDWTELKPNMAGFETRAGMLLRVEYVDDLSKPAQTYYHLVGTINENDGRCGCCSELPFPYDTNGQVQVRVHYRWITDKEALNAKLEDVETEDELTLAQHWYLDSVLELLEENPDAVKLTPPAKPPMGAPI